MGDVEAAAVEVELGLVGLAGPRLEAGQELGIEESFALVVEQQRVGGVAEGVGHRGGDEDVFPAVGVDVGGGEAPGPVVLEVELLAVLLELAVAEVAVEGVAEHAVGFLGELLDQALDVFVAGRDLAAHVRMHVGDVEVGVAVAVRIEELDAHGAPGGAREIVGGFFDEAFAALVLEVVVVALHAEGVDVGPAVAVQVVEAGVAGPARIVEAGRLGDVREFVAAEVVVEQARLGALGEGVAGEGVGEADVVAAAAALLGGVFADVRDEEVELAVLVVVEEEGARAVAGVGHAGRLADVAELAAAEVLEEGVAHAHGADEEVGVAVVVDVGEGGRDRDAVGHRHAGLFGDVGELAAAQVLPQLVRAELGDEVEVGPAVAVDVGGGEAVAVVVVHRFVVAQGVVGREVLEGDAAGGQAVAELEVGVDLELPAALALGRGPKVEGLEVDVLGGHQDLARVGAGGGGFGGAVVGVALGQRRQRGERRRATSQRSGRRAAPEAGRRFGFLHGRILQTVGSPGSGGGLGGGGAAEV